MHHDFLFHVSYTLTWWTNEDWARYCTEFKDHIILTYTGSKERLLFFFFSSSLSSLSSHIISSLLQASFEFALVCSLLLFREPVSLPFSGSLLSLRGKHGEADHYRSLPSSRGWDGLRDWSMTKLSFGVGWYLTYAGKRDDRCSNDRWFFGIHGTHRLFSTVYSARFSFQFHFVSDNSLLTCLSITNLSDSNNENRNNLQY